MVQETVGRKHGVSFPVLAILVVALTLSIHGSTARAVEAPDASVSGPFATATGEYRLPAQIYSDIRSNDTTEIWAKTHYPVDAPGDLPVIFVLHGNHSTCGRGSNPRIDDNCQYTDSGTCPNGYVVVPNHEGYDYVAEPLASWGYVVVSINANRGINCSFSGDPGDSGLNKARGRLILKHMQFVSGWNLGLFDLPGGFDEGLAGRLDFAEVGLMGHSRGGEGARAAYNFYLEPDSEWVEKIAEPVSMRAVFEIGAVDGQTDTLFEATNAHWNQILPMCDGDVSSLSGVKPLDRMMNELREQIATPKSSYTVWGANHNYFNSEWQSDDSGGCLDHPQLPAEVTGSQAQRLVGRSAIMAMMRGAVGPDADPLFLRNFNPGYELPTNVVETTRVDRAFVDSPRSRVEAPLENFSGFNGTNRWGFDNDDAGITLFHSTVPDHDSSLRAAQIDWSAAAPGRFLQVNIEDPGEGRDLSLFSTLDFRVSRQTSQPDFLSSTDFSISLVDADGVESGRVPLSDYTDLTGPVGVNLFFSSLRHPILQTARIPLSDFVGADPSRLRGVRFTFDIANPGETADDGGAIHLTDIRLSRALDESGPAGLRSTPSRRVVRDLGPPAPIARRAQSGRVANALRDGGTLRVTVSSDEKFVVGDALPVLRIGNASSTLGGYAPDLHSMTFEFEAGEIPLGASVELEIGPGHLWSFGEWIGETGYPES